MGTFDKKKTNRFIFIGNDKCRKTIKSCTEPEQLDIAIDMCNMFGRTVCGILNSEDFKWIAPHWNIHRRWCKNTYSVLNAALNELDGLINEQRAYIESHVTEQNTVGFK